MNIENLCQICQENSAPYKCPKCRMRYCSLTCYRDALHNKCSKEFDEHEIFDSMNFDEDAENNEQPTTTTNNFVRERIDEILKRKLEEKDLHNEEDDDQMDEFFEQMLPTKGSEAYRQGPAEMNEGDEERSDSDEGDLEGEERIDSDDEPLPDLPDDFDESEEGINRLWTHLTTDEKREFKSMLTDGRISHLLNDYKPWKPWWLYKTQAPALITDVNTTNTPPIFPDTVPTVVSPIVPLPSLTSVLPHVHVRFDAFEILFAYVLISIRYRGDLKSYLVDAGAEFLHIASRHLNSSPSLADNEEKEDPISICHARVSLVRECLQEKELSYKISEEFFVNLLADTMKIIHGPYPRAKPSNHFVLAALSDLKGFLLQMQDYQPPVVTEQPSKDASLPRNVFHANRVRLPKVTGDRTHSSKLNLRSSKTTVQTKATKKTSSVFNRRTLQILTRKIDYLLSWSITHANRLAMLDFELEQTEQDLRQQLSDYQRDKTQIEKHLKQIRLQQQSMNKSSRIEEL